jgi:hypothetical protein
MLCVPLHRVRTGDHRSEEFLYELKAGPAGGNTATGTGLGLAPMPVSFRDWADDDGLGCWASRVSAT